MNIVNINGSLNGVKFKCNKTNMVYSITGSKSTHQAGKDSALMVIDGAKGIEPQTKKLMEICRQRKMPVITLINKLDRECRSPIELLDQIESVLQVKPVPVTIPASSLAPSFIFV